MIYLDSRYATGTLFTAWDSRKSQYNLTVFRNFPSYQQKFDHYQWTAVDRLDLLANKFLGDSSLWWMITDINPEIVDPSDIPVGTILRMPRA